MSILSCCCVKLQYLMLIDYYSSFYRLGSCPFLRPFNVPGNILTILPWLFITHPCDLIMLPELKYQSLHKLCFPSQVGTRTRDYSVFSSSTKGYPIMANVRLYFPEASRLSEIMVSQACQCSVKHLYVISLLICIKMSDHRREGTWFSSLKHWIVTVPFSLLYRRLKT